MPPSTTEHWPEFLIEAALLGAFMVSASGVAVVLEHPASPVHQALPLPLVRHVMAGVAMGVTLIALVYSPLGRRSGAHMNPVLTLTFLRLGKIEAADACGYVVAQFVGAAAAMAVVASVAWPWLAHPAVDYVRTVPGAHGLTVAFVAEGVISFGMMLLVLTATNSERWRSRTGVLAGLLVAIYISTEAPLSGMSMNPARTLGPDVVAGAFDAVWLYFAAPFLGMLSAAELFVRRRGAEAVICAKLNHSGVARCIFRCGYANRIGNAALGQVGAATPAVAAPARR